jgi:arsenate reductase
MAEGIMKKLYGTDCYVQSAGLKNDLEIDGYAITVCAEVGVELSRHRSRSFDEMENWGDDLSSFDLVLALSNASHARVLELTDVFHTEVDFWPVVDPTGFGDDRELRLSRYREARDQIIAGLTGRWGPGQGLS